jgi:hypothetical protein
VYEASAAVGAAVALSLIGDPFGDAAFVDAIVCTRTTQNWGHLWRALSSAAVHLARNGRYEPTAILLGHLRHNHRWNVLPGDPGTDILGAVDELSTPAWTSTGAAMGVDDIVAFTLKTFDA